MTSAVVAHECFVAVAAGSGMPRRIQAVWCTATVRCRAPIEAVLSEAAGAARNRYKTLVNIMRRAHRRRAGEGRAATCQISLFGALRVSTGIRPSVSIIAVLHTAVRTSISSRSGHSHAMPSSRSALCARSSCTCMMPWPERRAGVELSQKCFVRITSNCFQYARCAVACNETSVVCNGTLHSSL